MKTILRNSTGWLASLSALVFVLQPSTCQAQGTAFTYQGRLESGGAPANGSFDLRFILYNAEAGGSQVGAILTNAATAISNGLFTVTLDFGAGVFTGADRWLEIGVRPSGGGAFTTLSPRQKLTATPYAITSANLSGTLAASQLSGTIPSANLGGTYSGALTFNNPANSFTGNGAGLTSLNASQLASGTVPEARLSANVSLLGQSIESGEITDGTIEAADVNAASFNTTFWRAEGNAGTTAGTHFLGTTDNQPLELKVNNQRALRLEPNTNGAPNVIGGAPWNFVGAGVVGATIGGGGATNYLGAAYTNSVLGDFGTIGGGLANTVAGFAQTIAGGSSNNIGTSAFHSAIGGGMNNKIAAAGSATIAGGEFNAISTNSWWSAIGGGYANYIAADSLYATIAGGWANAIRTNSWNSAIGGGDGNKIADNSWYATIAGGYFNNIGTNSWFSAIGGGWGNNIADNSYAATIAGGAINRIGTISGYSAIGGGWDNNIAANSQFATIPGGRENAVGANASYAFAAGRRAKANHTGTFVWADAANSDFGSTSSNQFLIRASGGVGIGTGNPQAALHVYSTNSPTTIRVQSSAGFGAGRIEFLSDPQGGDNEWRPGYIQSTDNGGYTGGLAFVVNGTGAGSRFGVVETMRIVNGRVGIGTNTDLSQKDCYPGGEDLFVETGRCAKSNCYPP
jgi:hypothetical protein